MNRRSCIISAFIVCLVSFRPALAQDVPKTHTVQSGETLFAIAQRYGLSVTELQKLNDLDGSTIKVGQVLRLGDSPEASTVSASTEVPGLRAVDGTASIVDVAFRLGVPVDSLLAENPDLPIAFSKGDSIRVPAEYATRSIRVRRGDTLYGLASRYGTTVSAIRALNRLRSDVLSVGQALDVPSGGVLPDEIGLPPVEAEGSIIEYPTLFEGRPTASGRPYDPEAYIVAHPTLELGTVVLLTATETGRSVLAEVADRMPSRADHLAEVSDAVARALGQPAGTVVLRIIDRPRTGGAP